MFQEKKQIQKGHFSNPLVYSGFGHCYEDRGLKLLWWSDQKTRVNQEWFEVLQLAAATGVHWLVPFLLQLKFSSGQRRLLTSSHSARFYKKTISSLCLDLQKESSLLSIWWAFRLKGFLDKTGRCWSRDAVDSNRHYVWYMKSFTSELGLGKLETYFSLFLIRGIPIRKFFLFLMNPSV